MEFVYLCIHCSRYTPTHTDMQGEDWQLCVKNDSNTQVEQLLKNQRNLTLRFCLQHLYFGGILGTDYLEFFAIDFEAFRLKFSPRCYVCQGRDICPGKGVNMTWQTSAQRHAEELFSRASLEARDHPPHHLCLAVAKAARRTGAAAMAGNAAPQSSPRVQWRSAGDLHPF